MTITAEMANSPAVYDDEPTYTEPAARYVALYAGAGGLDLGFALAGFQPAWTSEIDSFAIATHRTTFEKLAAKNEHMAGSHVYTAGDLLAIDPRDLPRKGSAEIVIGGPPCQGFSVAGKMDPHDERSKHVFHFMDVVEHVGPEVFVMENVKSLYLNSRWSAVRDELRLKAAKLGYNAEMYLLNAADYGVPQARERMFFIGIKRDVGQPSRPQATTPGAAPTVRDALAALPRYGESGNNSICTAKITPAKSPVLRRSPYAGMLFNGAGRPLNLDAPSMTLPASMGGNKTPIVEQDLIDCPDAGSWVRAYHKRLWISEGRDVIETVPPTLRRITVEEAAAIQTFPADFGWVGPQSAKYRQIGNAVPPRLALAVARSIRQALGL